MNAAVRTVAWVAHHRNRDNEGCEFMAAHIAVVVCSFNGARRLGSCLQALLEQQCEDFEIVVVDDGSRDHTSSVAEDAGVPVVRHPLNLGLAAARNTGVASTSAPVVAFTDDDCVPPKGWVAGIAECLLKAQSDVVAVGGSVVPAACDTVARRYALLTSPLAPLEIRTASAGGVGRLRTYVRGPSATETSTRSVASLVGANMAFRREALEAEGGFDRRIEFGGEEEDMCRRLTQRYGAGALLFVPELRMWHDFAPEIADVLRRARAYGRGNARTFLKAGGRIPSGSALPAIAASSSRCRYPLARTSSPRPGTAAAATPHAIGTGVGPRARWLQLSRSARGGGDVRRFPERVARFSSPVQGWCMVKASVVVLSKDEPALANTLAALEGLALTGHEVLVVDASAGRLEGTRAAHPWVRWLDFTPPTGVRVSIPHQRNEGVRAAAHDLIVFTDAGCVPAEDWFDRLCEPIVKRAEDVVCGSAVSPGYDIYGGTSQRGTADYLDECPTINLAFRREVYDDVGGFDESFQYGSDVDFSWRVVATGRRIRNAPDSIVSHAWGGPRRQVRRAYLYGQARVRLYAKHRDRLPSLLKRDPITVIYALFVLGLPLSFRYPAYLSLLAIPLWRNRHRFPLLTTADHLAYGAGALRQCGRELRAERNDGSTS